MNQNLNPQRAANLAIVQKFFESFGADRLPLFTEDGVKELPWTSMGKPIVFAGFEQLKHNFLTNAVVFNPWSWHNVELYETLSDDEFWVECDGKGDIRVEGHPVVHYEQHYVMFFRMREGKIALFREFCNPTVKPTDDQGQPTTLPPLGNPHKA